MTNLARKNRWLAVCLTVSCLHGQASAHTVADFLPLQYRGIVAPFGFDGTEVYTDVWGAGNYAYLGTQSSGVAIIDVSDSKAPYLVDVFGADLNVSFTDVRVHDAVGYFSTTSNGTYLVDVTSPSTPELLSQAVPSISPADINNDGRVDSADLNVLGVNWQARVDVHENGDLSGDGFVDATDLNLLGVRWQERVSGAAVTNAFVADEFLFQVSETSAAITVMDISEPTRPAFVRRIETTDTVGIYDLTISGDRLYAAGMGGTTGAGATYIYDVSSLGEGTVPLVAEIPTGANTSSVGVNGDGSKLVVTHRVTGGTVAAWDISNPLDAFQIDEANATDFGVSAISAGAVTMLGDIAYTAYHQAGVQVLDLALLEASDTIFRTGAFGTSQASPLDGFVGNTSVYPLGHDKVLLADSRWGLYIVDATNVVEVGANAPVPEPRGAGWFAIGLFSICDQRRRRKRLTT